MRSNSFRFSALSLVQILALLVVSTAFSETASAQSKACEQEIKRRYESSRKDRYGNTSDSKLFLLNYYATMRPGSHKFGNNDALFYLAGVDRYENGRLSKRDTVKLYCVVNKAGKILGLERGLD